VNIARRVPFPDGCARCDSPGLRDGFIQNAAVVIRQTEQLKFPKQQVWDFTPDISETNLC
jgi:hypothetical protein